MKKFVSLILSLIMLLGVSTVAFAQTTEETPKEEPIKYVDNLEFKKVYELLNDKEGLNPKEDFTFTIEKVGVTDSVYTDDNMPMFESNTFKISFAEGDAVTNGTKTATIALPDYKHVGIFTYKITETAGNTAGIVYDTQEITLKVTVVDVNGQLKKVVALHSNYGVQGKDIKVDGITNTYKAGNLAITKEVTGNMGEKDRYFAIDVTLNAPTGKTVASTISVAKTSYATNPTSIEVGKTKTFYLKHGETITLGNVPYDVTYTVVEKDYTGNNGGYDEAKYTYSDETRSVDLADETVKIINSKQRGVDTGVLVDNLPYIAILGIVVAGMGAFFIKRRTANNN